jgi:DNA polymerase III epsilon subunit
LGLWKCGIPEFLLDKPVFADVAADFLQFIRGAELVIHNAPFDLGFLDMELSLLQDCPGTIRDFCSVVDTLELARELHPGQRNNLDALCKRTRSITPVAFCTEHCVTQRFWPTSTWP